MNINNLNIKYLSLAVIILLAAAAWILLQKSPPTANNKQDRDSDKVTTQVKVINGIAAIDLSTSEQVQSGITTIQLNQRLHQVQLTAYGSVVSIQDLSKDVQSFDGDKVLLIKSTESLFISRGNFERIKSLYHKKLASEQDFQSSQAAFLSDQADVKSASSNLNSLRSSIVEQWGDNLSKWIFDDSPKLQRLLSLKDKLVQVSLPSEKMGMNIPSNIFIQSPSEDNKKILCGFVSAGFIANAQFQTKTLYYITDGSSLNGGMNVKAFLPAGKRMYGVIVPSGSIIWYRGKAWVYAEKSPNQFIRVEINTNNPVEDGFFIPQNAGLINSGIRVVNTGAQLLFSREVAPAQSSQADGGDND